MYKLKEDNMNVPCCIWSERGNIEQGAIDQIKNASSLPFVFHHTALMPDAHQGYGVSIGSVFATEGVVIPNAVGVDIGCGMCAVKTSLTGINTETLKKIMGEIRKVVPVGFNKHKEEQDIDLMPLTEEQINGKVVDGDFTDLPIINKEYDNALKSLGTLGGGNHFIELQKGSDGHIWIMIHSGSRNLGKQVADYYNKLAIELNEKWHSQVPKKWELAFLQIYSDEGQAYIEEMNYCVDYALANRKLMMERVKQVFEKFYRCYEDFKDGSCNFQPMINIAHNYATMENHFGQNVMVHRKGATLASEKTIGIIPGSQGTSSYIVKGKGNPDSFNSCSHGAGRKMSRTKARNELDLNREQEKLNKQGIIHGIRSDKDLDEASGAYKDIDEVMENQKDLIEVLVKLTPLAVIKG
jgi:tRNA-splicing ligase RtcB